MKNILPIIFIGALVLAIATSCGSSRASCDAYGNVNTPTQQSDLASK